MLTTLPQTRTCSPNVLDRVSGRDAVGCEARRRESYPDESHNELRHHPQDLHSSTQLWSPARASSTVRNSIPVFESIEPLPAPPYGPMLGCEAPVLRAVSTVGRVGVNHPTGGRRFNPRPGPKKS